jgi:outer membrane protein assembly complex protein YaeT
MLRHLGLLIVGLLLVGQSALFAQEDSRHLRIRNVEFSGNRTFPDIVLRSVVANRNRSLTERFRLSKDTGFHFDEAEIRRDVIRLQRYYQRRGFPAAVVTVDILPAKHDDQRDLRFHIAEGEPVMIASLQIHWSADADSVGLSSQRAFRRAMVRNPLREGERYESILIADAEGLFQNTLQNLGYAFVTTDLTGTVDSSKTRAAVVLRVDPGPLTKIDSIHVVGETSVSKALIRRESGISPGDVYSQRALGRAQQEIFSHHLFRFVTVSVPEQPRDSTVNLFIRVREHPLRSIRAQAGFGNEEYLRGNLSWTHRNPFGNAHSFSSSVRASFLEQRINVDYVIPYVYNTSSSFLISPFAQRLNESSYLLLRMGANNTFLYRYSQNLVGTVSYEFTRNEEFLKSTERVLRDSTQLYDLSALQLSGYYQRLIVERSEGWAIRPFLEFSGLFGLGTLTYQKLSLDVRRYLTMGSGSQIALRVDTGFLLGSSDDVVPANIRFYAGGTNSVRGYDRWQLGPRRSTDGGLVPDGGRAAFTFNTEYRKNASNVIQGLSLNAFFDGGNVWRTIDQADPQDIRYSIGGGVGYASFLGPIRLDVGYKLNPSPQDLETALLGRWGLHLSIGQTF